MAAWPAIFLHQVIEFRPIAEVEDLADRTRFLVGVDQLIAVGIEGGESGGELAAVLDVQEHPRHQPGDFFGSLLGAERTHAVAGEMVDRHHATFVADFGHDFRQKEFGTDPPAVKRKDCRSGVTATGASHPSQLHARECG